MHIFWSVLLVVVSIAGWLITVLGLPGTWVMVAAAALYVWLLPAEASTSFGWGIVAILFFFAALGEVIEFGAGSIGAAKGGGSKRSAVLALAGSIVGAIAGLFIGTPVPVIGSLVLSILLSAVGALVGALLGELWKGRSFDAGMQTGHAAFWGRILGTLAKALVAAVMLAVVLAAVVL
jgi:uncharacterized protein YqgC (DUF456 family)